jgi:hypothetical protein
MAVPGATTATDTLTANPDGTLTLRHSQLPVRKLVNRAWRPLSATLRRGSDGSIAPGRDDQRAEAVRRRARATRHDEHARQEPGDMAARSAASTGAFR